MATVRRLRKDSHFYLIPIVLGLLGVLFASQLDDPVLKTVIILLCLVVPLVAGGNVLARFQTEGFQRLILLFGMAMLVIGAGVSLAGYTESLVEADAVSDEVGQISRQLGLASLLLGLLVVLFSAIRSHALVDELSDRFYHIADHMAEGFVITANDGTIVLVNRSLMEMTGLTEDQLVGRKIGAVTEEFNSQTLNVHVKSQRQGFASEYQFSWLKNGDERTFWVHSTPIYDNRSRQIGTLSTIRDITDQARMSRRLEEYAERLQHLVEERTTELRDSEQRLRGLLLHMQEGFVTVDHRYRIQFANRRLQDMLNINYKDLLDREIFDLLDSEGRRKLLTTLTQLRDDGVEHMDQEYRFLRDDGTDVAVKVAISPVEPSNNGKQSYSLVITDVTELKEMQVQLEERATQLEEMNEELRALDRAKDIFLSNVSHELRTPLSTLQGYIEMLESGSLGAVEGPQAGAYAVMARNAYRLSRLINEMIEFSRMEIRGVRLEKTLLHPETLVQECASSARPDALKKDITITPYAANDIPYMWGDPDKLTQVIGILLSNAIKFSHDNDMIQVGVKRVNENDVHISVTDTGIGIDPKYHERVFAKFYQVDNSLSRNYQGTGIGLSIAKSIVEAHGGAVRIGSAPGKGSTFTIELPDACFTCAPGAFSGAGLDQLTVYVLNERTSFNKAVAELLDSRGVTVQTFVKGHELLRCVSELAPDVVIVDEVLSDIGGLEVVERLKTGLATSDIPVILCRNGSGETDLHNIVLLEGVYVLAKPFRAEMLLTKIDEAVRAPVPGTPLS